MIIRLLTILFLSMPIYAGSELNVIPGNSVVQNSNFAINIKVVRDTGPVTRMDASGLIIKIDFYTANKVSLPITFRILDARAFFQKQSWNMNDSTDISISRYFDGSGYVIIFREGPLWSIGEPVSVELQFEIGSVIYQYTVDAIVIEKS